MTDDQHAREVAGKLSHRQREAVVQSHWSERDGAWHPEGWYTASADKRVRRNLCRAGVIRDYLRWSYPLTPLGLRVRAILNQPSSPSGAST